MTSVSVQPRKATLDPMAAQEMNEWMKAVAASQDRQAFARLFHYYAPRIKAYLMRMGATGQVAEELAQETLLALWRRAESFDPQQASLSTWVFTIARNRWIDVVRREKHPEIGPEEFAMGGDPAPLPDRIYQKNQESERIRLVLDQLPDEQAELIKLAYFQDMAHGKIVEVTGLPLGTVKSRLRLALEKLRRELKDWDYDDQSSP
jgi:RNA polymerase sigma-70 factor (ECF subfamily)